MEVGKKVEVSCGGTMSKSVCLEERTGRTGFGLFRLPNSVLQQRRTVKNVPLRILWNRPSHVGSGRPEPARLQTMCTMAG